MEVREERSKGIEIRIVDTFVIIKPTASFQVVYYESLKRELKTKPTNECRCDEDVVYYESLKRELKTKTIYGFRCDERLQTIVYSES